MNRIFGIIAVATLYLPVSAQIVANDTVTTSSENRDMTFYSLQSGQKTLTANNDWHLAVSVRPSEFPSNTLQGTTLRINEAFGVKAYLVPGFDADSFSVSIDTTGYRFWQRLSDSDSLLDLGALNKGLNIGAYNYGWGFYSGPPNHNVVGNKVYLLELPGGGIKKLLVYQLDKDTAWDFKYADIDNVNFQLAHISKKDYPGKNFVYLNLSSSSVQDKEPLSANWDLQFLKYSATDIQPGRTVPIVGVWSNKGTAVAKRKGVDAASNDYSNTTFSSAMNTIGWDWKYLVTNQQNLSAKDVPYYDNKYRMDDSLAYFIQNLSGETYKIVFTGFGGVSNGVISFYKEHLAATEISETDHQTEVSIYPNPCNSILNVLMDVPATFKICDLNGRVIEEKSASEKIVRVNTSELPNGIYLLSVVADGNTSVHKLVVNH